MCIYVSVSVYVFLYVWKKIQQRSNRLRMGHDPHTSCARLVWLYVYVCVHVCVHVLPKRLYIRLMSLGLV